MKRSKLSVEKRTLLGKKVKKLRKSGILPANIYGKGVKSLAVQLKEKEFEKIFKEEGSTGLIDIAVDGQLRPVLIHNVQRDPLMDTYLHADFYQVNLKEKITTNVPLVTVGEPKAVTDKLGLLIQPLSEVEVEALPEELPERIEVDVTHLAALDEQITVADLKAPKGVAILTDPSQVVAKITELVSKEAEEQIAQEAAAKEEAKAEAEAEAPAEGEEKPAPIESEQAQKEEEKKEEQS